MVTLMHLENAMLRVFLFLSDMICMTQFIPEVRVLSIQGRQMCDHIQIPKAFIDASKLADQDCQLI